jgi:uncharacterized protein
LARELDVGLLALEDILEALVKPGRDPRDDLPPPIFRRDVVKFEQLQEGMEMRGTVLNVVDFGAFVDVGLSDSGLVHISQLTSGYVRDPHEVVSVGDQVLVWVASIDKERRRVALTMIPPGTEKPARPPRSRKGRSRRPAAIAAQGAENGKQTGRERGDGRDKRPGKRRRPRRDREPDRQPRTGAYEKRASKVLAPITKEMEEGKEFMRSFGDLLQFHQKKAEQKKPPPASESPSGDNK